jgi:pimeloyl-ACP methyl ester carboxylesterase
MCKTALIGGAPVRYEIHGAGWPIIMLHGFAVDRHSMIGCMEPVFADRPGWQRIYLDLPGMGETPPASNLSSTDALRDMVLSFADQIIPGQRFAIAGKSYGGYLARGVVSRRPERVDGAAFICPAVIADREARDVPELTVITRDEAVLESLSKEELDEFTPYFSVQDGRTWARFAREFLPGVRRADLRGLAALSQQYPFSESPEVQDFPQPVLWLMGRQDANVGYRDAWPLLESFPRASFAVLDRAAHNLEIEQDALFEALIGEWLDRVAEAAPR